MNPYVIIEVQNYLNTSMLQEDSAAEKSEAKKTWVTKHTTIFDTLKALQMAGELVKLVL